MIPSTKATPDPRAALLKRASDLLTEEGTIERDLADLAQRRDSVVLELDGVCQHLFGCFYAELTADQTQQLYTEIQDLEVFGIEVSDQLANLEVVQISEAGMPLSRAAAVATAKEEICQCCGARDEPAIGCHDCHVEVPEDAVHRHQFARCRPTSNGPGDIPEESSGNDSVPVESEA